MTLSKLAGLIAFALLLAMPAGAFSAPSPNPSPEEVARRLQAQYDQTRNFIADFQQSTTMEMSGRKKVGRGRVTLQKPGRMRWDYLEPDRQVLICDGEKIIMYLEKSHQMIISSAKEYLASDVTYSFFTGNGNILRDFEVQSATDVPEQAPGLATIKLIPKTGHPHVDHLYLWVDTSDYLLRAMRIIDHLGSVTDIVFSNLQRNVEIPSDVFTFDPPEGTEIIRQ